MSYNDFVTMRDFSRKRNRGLKNYAIVIAGLFVVALGIIVIQNQATSQGSTMGDVQIGTLAGLQTTDAPWNAGVDHLRERLTTISLPALTAEGTALHTHQHLDIFIHGRPIAVPSGIGVNESAGFISPIHVHDTTNVIHVESPLIQKFTLGQFFDVWGVRFDQNAIGGYVADATSTLKIYVNGELFSGNPRTIELTAHEEIAITFGTSQEQIPIPATYLFSPEL
ncbi:MAG: hypothetical protein WCW78_03670 [Candidatus Paceibacterota bacterium]